MPRIPLLVISLFFFTGGTAHLVFTGFFMLAMPDYLGYHRELVLISGVFEILGATGILIPKTRRIAGYGLIALIIAVFPANIYMALHPDQFRQLPVIFLYLRLPLQFLFVWMVWWAIKPERRQSESACK